MTILENAMVGQHCRSKGGVFGSIVRTPGIRAEEERIRRRAEDALAFFGKRLSGYRLEQPASRSRTRTDAGWRWPARWPPTRSSCSWTSRRPA